MVQFMTEMGFERAGIFAYSPEEGTPAAAMTNQVSHSDRTFSRFELLKYRGCCRKPLKWTRMFSQPHI